MSSSSEQALNWIVEDRSIESLASEWYMLAFPFSELSSPISCLPILRSYTNSAGQGGSKNRFLGNVETETDTNRMPSYSLVSFQL